MRILGVDPGIAITGWGIVESGGTSGTARHIEHGVITTEKSELHGDRLTELYTDMNALLEEFAPDYAAVEQLFFCRNAKTASAVGEARGVILMAISRLKIPILEFTPMQIKDGITGYGRASKKQIQEMVGKLLELEEVPSPDDAADGLAVAMCALHVVSAGASAGMPRGHLNGTPS
ncbi:MAG: crossover junction endodeoxyribonuclease RuvC [Candidatus Dojkabacteria bacterium]|nr:crossover junction endodeoxyribonuclease RuvC [Candidatus Dojkabacteria bacterium]